MSRVVTLLWLAVIVIAGVGLVRWLFQQGHWVLAMLASLGANLGVVWGLIQLDRRPRTDTRPASRRSPGGGPS